MKWDFHKHIILLLFISILAYSNCYGQAETFGPPPFWKTKGNINIVTPAAPATYGTTAINALATGENWIGTTDANDFVVGTNYTERMRVTSAGNIGIGTATPNTQYLISLKSAIGSIKSGIEINMSGMSSTAYGINLTTANSNVNGILVTNSTTSTATSVYNIGAVLSSTRIASGYLAYRSNVGNTYGVYGIAGTNAAYTTNTNTWAGFYNGRVAISSVQAPSSDDATALEVQNTIAGAGNPANIMIRQTNSNNANNTILGQLNFGDNFIKTAQSSIEVIRGAASSGATDLPTAMLFYTTPDASAIPTERMRILESGNVGINNPTPTEKLDVTGNVRFSGALMPNNNAGAANQILTSTGPGTAPIWKNANSIIESYTSGAATRTNITSTDPTYTDVSGLSVTVTLSKPATVYIFSTGSLETWSSFYGGSGCIIRVKRDATYVTNGTQVVDINDASGVTGTIGIWSISTTETLPAGTYVYKVQAAKYAFDSFYAGGNSTAPSGFQNQGSLIVQVFY